MHLNCPSTECWKPCRAASSSGTAWVAMLMRGRSLLGQSSRYLAMMTRPVLTKPFKARSMIVIFIPVYDILILSQSCHSSVPNWHALKYLLAYTMTDTYLLTVLWLWGQSPWNWGKIKKACRVCSFENFTWIRQISIGNQRWCSNLIWKQWRLPHLEPRCRTGWCKKSIYFVQKMNTCMHFMHPPKIVQIG